ncbi:MAG: hypothetical protein ACUZ8H_11500, partial [Candidatus Anammoxibacter sp.]
LYDVLEKFNTAEKDELAQALKLEDFNALKEKYMDSKDAGKPYLVTIITLKKRYVMLEAI